MVVVISLIMDSYETSEGIVEFKAVGMGDRCLVLHPNEWRILILLIDKSGFCPRCQSHPHGYGGEPANGC